MDKNKDDIKTDGKIKRMGKTNTLDVIFCLLAAVCIIALVITVIFQSKSRKELENFELENVTKSGIQNISEIMGEDLPDGFSLITTEFMPQQSTDDISEFGEKISQKPNSEKSATNTTTATAVKNNANQKPKETATAAEPETTTEKVTEIDSILIINKSSKKIHSSTCPYAKNINAENRYETTGDRLQLYLDDGYAVCSHCHAYK